MPTTPSQPTTTSGETGPRFTIRSKLSVHGQKLQQTQFAAKEYVLTRIARSTTLFAPGLGGRFLVDTDRHELRRVDPSRQQPEPERVRALLGKLLIDETDEVTEIQGRPCRLIRIRNQDARLVLAVDCYCCRIESLDRTALAEERAFDQRFHPFNLPLGADEVVARSTTRALAADFEQSQVLQLEEVRSGIHKAEDGEECLLYPIVAS